MLHSRSRYQASAWHSLDPVDKTCTKQTEVAVDRELDFYQGRQGYQEK